MRIGNSCEILKQFYRSKNIEYNSLQPIWYKILKY